MVVGMLLFRLVPPRRRSQLRCKVSTGTEVWFYSAKPARPNIVRLSIFSLLICPSTGLVDQGVVIVPQWRAGNVKWRCAAAS